MARGQRADLVAADDAAHAQHLPLGPLGDGVEHGRAAGHAQQATALVDHRHGRDGVGLEELAQVVQAGRGRW